MESPESEFHKSQWEDGEDGQKYNLAIPEVSIHHQYRWGINDHNIYKKKKDIRKPSPFSPRTRALKQFHPIQGEDDLFCSCFQLICVEDCF